MKNATKMKTAEPCATIYFYFSWSKEMFDEREMHEKDLHVTSDGDRDWRNERRAKSNGAVWYVCLFLLVSGTYCFLAKMNHLY